MSRESLYTRDFSLLCAGYLFIGTAYYFLIPTLPLYLVDTLHVAERDVGFYMSIYVFAAMAARPLVGFILDRYGKRIIFIPAFFIYAIPFVGHAFTSSLSLFILFRLIHGFSWAIITAAGATIVMDLIPSYRRGEGLGYYGLAFSTSFAFGPALGLYVLHRYSAQTMFLVAAVLTLIAFLLVNKIDYPKVSKYEHKFNLKQIFVPRIFPTCINVYLQLMVYGYLVTFLPLYARVIKFEKYTALFFLIMAFGTILNRLVTGKIFDRKGPKFLGCIGMLTLAIGYILVSQASSIFIFLIAAFLCGFGTGATTQVLQAMTNIIALPHERGGANATYYLAFDLGFATGIFCGGLLTVYFSFSQIYFLTAILCILNLFLFLFVNMKNYTIQLIKNAKYESGSDDTHTHIHELRL